VRRLAAAKRLAATALGLSLLAAAAGCGLPVDQSPLAIPSNEVPPALLQSQQQENLGSVPNADSVPTTIYLLCGSSELTGVKRLIRRPASVQEVLDALEAGPSGPKERGCESAIPADANLVAEGVNNGVATIELDKSFGDLLTTQAINGYAQIVWSVMSLPYVHNGVMFFYDGAVLAPVLPNGSILKTGYVVTTSDYKTLV
jgi:Sporulation and spore germination